ncbi:MAG: GxxExxY protein [Ignavibacteriae bacterium]|nr:GxxExxY protein [Ignavibacteriota bacterium]
MTQKYINDLAYKIVGCAIEVHKNLGPGLLESIYEKCLLEELKEKKLIYNSQVQIPLIYKNKSLECNLILDIIVEDLIIVELKAVETIIPVHKAQLLTYLKLTNKPKELLINFNCENITNSLVSLVTEDFSVLPKE